MSAEPPTETVEITEGPPPGPQDPLIKPVEPKRTLRERVVDGQEGPDSKYIPQYPAFFPNLIALILTLGVVISIIILAVHADNDGGPPTYVLATVFGAVVGAVAVYLGMTHRH